MIPLARFTSMRIIDYMVIVIAAIIWAALTTLINQPDTQLTFMLVLGITSIFATFIALLIRRAGAVVLFYLLGSLISISFNNLIIGYQKIIILLIAGILFELVIVINNKLNTKNIPLNVLIAAALSHASIPWTMLLLTNFTKEILPATINFSLSSLLIGIIGAVIAYLIWYSIRSNKKVIKFEYAI